MNDIERDNIKNIFHEIQDSKLDSQSKIEKYSEKYPEFKEKYPKFFESLCNGTMNVNTFKFMLEMLYKMEHENLSQYDASSKVGTLLYNNYIEPKVTKIN